jgi:hypothetical protein
MLTVHVRVNDEASGQPTPVRLRITDAAGVNHVPLGRLAEFSVWPGTDVGGHLQLGHQRWVYIDGTCEVRLPPGPVTFEVCKGLEYTPLRRTLTLGPGQMAVRLSIGRWIDLRDQGWFPGDVRAHEPAPHAALLEGSAEGLRVVNLLARERPAAGGMPAALPGLLAFSGTRPALEGPDCQVVVNTLNSHPVLGTVGLLNSHRPVYPLRFGSPGAADDWSVADWCDQCHRKAGLVTWPDLPRLSPAHPQGEALAAVVLGKVDAFEVGPFTGAEPEALADWYRLLDCGFRVPLAGASAKESNAVALGSMRTYACLLPGESFQFAGWIEAIRAGRTFVTNGPLLTLSVDGQAPGAVLAVQPDQPLPMRAEVHSLVPIEELEVLVNGEVVAVKSAAGNRQAAVLEIDLTCQRSAWVAARCKGDPLDDQQPAFAHTSAVFVEVSGQPTVAGEETLAPLLAVLEGTCDWVERQARCGTDKHRGHLREVLNAAREALLARRGD